MIPKTINCKGKLIDLSTPKVMGILNLTPDSFYDGNTLHSNNDILNRVDKMLNEGATFIDVGGYSSRPNASHISVTEEINRVLPIVELLAKEFPEILLSIDTFRSEVAKAALNAGACMVNDISAGNLDPSMFDTIAQHQVPYIMMHMPGNPQTMQKHTSSYQNIIVDLKLFFAKKLATLNALKVNDVLIDVGFGFGKTNKQNYTLLHHLDLFNDLDLPIVTGISRKSMLYKPLNVSPAEALNATTAAHTIALLKGSQILRVHDVKEAIETIQIVQLTKNAKAE
ncbi:dihydropteroate synthase [Flavobacteriaceae bacterium F08102]|nr:dihydropteroate synthase [Flavobacteriaceae bacterium F08102]